MRPTEYNYTLAREIAFAVGTSATKLAELCNRHSHWPKKDTIVKWLREHGEFASLIVEAVQLRDGDLIDDESME